MTRRRIGRVRGGQPGNKNALKHGRYARAHRQVREFDHFLRLHHYEAARTGDLRVLKRYEPIIERLARETADLDQALFDRMALRGSTPQWIVDEIARADRESRVREDE